MSAEWSAAEARMLNFERKQPVVHLIPGVRYQMHPSSSDDLRAKLDLIVEQVEQWKEWMHRPPGPDEAEYSTMNWVITTLDKILAA